MRWILELRQSPELLARDGTLDVLGNVVVYLVVRHGAYDHVVGMGLAVAARDDEVEPLLAHLRKLQDVEALGEADHVGVLARHRHALRPALGLLADDGAVKPRSEVFRVAPDSNLGRGNDVPATVIHRHKCHSPRSSLWSRPLYRQNLRRTVSPPTCKIGPGTMLRAQKDSETAEESSSESEIARPPAFRRRRRRQWIRRRRYRCAPHRRRTAPR